MKKITEQQIKDIVTYLENAIVPSIVGANLIAISNLLKKLPDVEEKKK
jgi:hypothetical protein